ncbi:MAG: hypothetical protein NC253_14170 [Ruminococcus sp.]|nr:hypothetical protein [Ruminococcus sp.]MCM1381000.1 hypothetical protein [Muribaculaceae bacterium]MCM1479243.1 hypothetical protein [Muribaculaceae bacterium]
MQAIMETSFDIVYLILVIAVGIRMIIKSRGEKQYFLFGIMAVILGSGDAFHLLPRAYALCTTGLENFTAALGIGKLITSVTMTVFYVLLYFIWRIRYNVKDVKALTACVCLFAAARIILCFFPQNRWTSADAPWSWGIYRNIPFVLLGLVIIVIFFKKVSETNDKGFRFMWLAVLLSFGFYIPVVLFADSVPMLGMLMIPKTCVYVWIVLMGYFEMKKTG